MLSPMQEQWTYAGTLDDVVFRYPWNRPTDLHSLKHQLVTAAIYDKKVVINDGYLVANPQIVSELANPKQSPIGSMLMTGQACLFTRGSGFNIAEGIERQAGRVNTHRALIEQPSWRFLRDDLEWLSRYTRSFSITWPPDKNMGEAFYLLVAELAQEAERRFAQLAHDRRWVDFRKVFSAFDREIAKPAYLGARSLWEEVCWRELTPSRPEALTLMNTPPDQRARRYPGYEAVRPMMCIANQLYHYAYAAALRHALTDQESRQEASVGVATGFEFLHLGFTEVGSPRVDWEGPRQQALARMALSLPSDLRFRKGVSVVADIESDGPCRRARFTYLEHLQLVMERGDVFPDALDARRNYISELSRILHPMIEEKSLEAVAKALTTPFDFVLDKVLPVLGSIVGFVIGVDRLQNRLLERLMKARVAAALDEGTIRAIQDGLPLPGSRYAGLYYGPVGKTAASRLIEAVSPP